MKSIRLLLFVIVIACSAIAQNTGTGDPEIKYFQHLFRYIGDPEIPAERAAGRNTIIANQFRLSGSEAEALRRATADFQKALSTFNAQVATAVSGLGGSSSATARLGVETATATFDAAVASVSARLKQDVGAKTAARLVAPLNRTPPFQLPQR